MTIEIKAGDTVRTKTTGKTHTVIAVRESHVLVRSLRDGKGYGPVRHISHSNVELSVSDDMDHPDNANKDYSDITEKLVDHLEEYGAEPGWSTLDEIVIDYILGELNFDMLVYRYKCIPARATFILSLLKGAMQ